MGVSQVAKSLALLIVSGCLFTGAVARGQELLGGEQRILPVAAGDERTAQSDLWVMEVYFKPMRLISVELTDPQTGEKRSEYVRYIAYRAFNRPFSRKEDPNRPKNVVDKAQIPPLFIPEFLLVAKSNEREQLVYDEVIPEVIAAINAREQFEYKSSVDVVGPIPAAAEEGTDDAPSVAGVAVFRGVDPSATRYTVFMTGFSNGVRSVKGPDGSLTLQHKTIMQKYWRPGDKFDQQELEIKLMEGQKDRPQWIWR